VHGDPALAAGFVSAFKIAGIQQAFFYDRPGETCALDLLPKELQPDV
jgi:hypothetical protein